MRKYPGRNDEKFEFVLERLKTSGSNKRHLMYQHYVSISLFVHLDKCHQRTMLTKDSSLPELYSVGFVDGRVLRQIGWIAVYKTSSPSSFWNRRMQERTDIHCLFSNDSYGPIPNVGFRIRDVEWQPVQLTTEYPVTAFTQKRAAQKAWDALLSGSRTYTEWYDASRDQRWTKMFGLPPGAASNKEPSIKHGFPLRGQSGAG